MTTTELYPPQPSFFRADAKQGGSRSIDGADAWEAVVQRDRAYRDQFVFAVRTTGIYCRPGCPSRTPQRDHVEFFTDPAAARAAGYRACKRCDPDAVAPDAALTAVMTAACRRLAAAPVDLATLAAEAGYSVGHFQRLFKQLVGVTPAQYGRRQRADRFSNALTSSESVTDAIYDAGLSSPSRAHALARTQLGLRPSAVRARGEGETITYALAECALGWALIATTADGLCAIELGDSADSALASFTRRFAAATVREDADNLTDQLQQVIAFLDQPGTALDLPLDIRGTAFQQRVWQALRAIPAGQTRSYGELAATVAPASSPRAVANACAANPLAVVIPCHRIVRTDGDLGGYRWGLERKRALLELETKTPSSARGSRISR